MHPHRLSVISHPFRGNYGGMLQAYALQEVLKRLGGSVRVLDLEEAAFAGELGMKRVRRLCFIARLLRRMGLRMKRRHVRAFQLRMGREFAARFVERAPLGPDQAAWESFFADTDACIVGSDQVWRAGEARGCSDVPFFFLKYAPAAVRARSISYAASFGTDVWEGTPDETAESAALLRDFRAVSVREHSGIALCRDALGRSDALQMPDPTLLAEEHDYRRIIESAGVDPSPSRPYLVDYILDAAPEKRRLIRTAAQAAELQDTRALMFTRTGRADGAMQPYSVGEWLHTIRHAALMVTDSFHGCVFSIIFNTPFICIPNGARGNSRFETLLRTYGLEDRILSPDATEADIARLCAAPIDWATVNARRAAERERGLRFLRDTLPQGGSC